jgi:hypothetical protein
VSDGERRDWLVRPVTGKQPLFGVGMLPIVAELDRQFGRQHDIAIFVAFALINPDQHVLAVNRSRLEADGLGDLQTGRVTDGQNHAMLQVVHGAQVARHFVLAQYDRKLFCLAAGGDVVLDNPVTLGRDGVEKNRRRRP